MSEQLYAWLVVFLEMIFLFTLLAALCHQRKTIGRAAFGMVVALLLLFQNLTVAGEFTVRLSGESYFYLGEVVFFVPVLCGFLLYYIVCGALSTQRLLLGIVISFLLYVYFAQLTNLQCNWEGITLGKGFAGGTVNAILNSGREMVNMYSVSHLLQFLTAPVIYSRIAKSRRSRRAAVPAALIGALLVGRIPIALTGFYSRNYIQIFDPTFFLTLAAVILLSLFILLYLEKVETELPVQQSSAWTFLFTFFGSYGKLQLIESHLREWENRYYTILRNMVEAVVMIGEDGTVIEANITAGNLLASSIPEKLVGRNIFSCIEISETSGVTAADVLKAPCNFRCRTTGTNRILFASIAPVEMRGRKLWVMIGRDVTDEIRLAEEKAQLTEQLNHSQRLESLGRLAGGLAHDFNNYIHAILGHVDVATMLDSGNQESMHKHFEKIGVIAERAGKLTSQMLGFARKGKYHIVDVNLEKLFEDCRTMLGPQKLRDVDFLIVPPREKLTVSGDLLQLQQALLNILLNAIDAMEQSAEKNLLLQALPASQAPLKFSPPPSGFENVSAEDYLCIIIADSGCGMDNETCRRIFEPFFTTKPVGVGTGMGLPMVYGIISNHKGWIQLESRHGGGTTFAIFLPHKV